MNYRIDTAASRARLPLRREPYWMAIPDITGAYVGFRRGPDTWLVRLREDGRQIFRPLGLFEDHRAAIRSAREWIQSRDLGVTSLDATVADACRAYVVNLEQEKGIKAAREAYSRLQRTILGRTADEARAARAKSVAPNKLAKKLLAKLRAVDIEAWRNALIPEGRVGEARRKAAASANRDMTALIAALNYGWKRQMVVSNSAWATVGKFGDVQAKNHRRFVPIVERKALLSAAKPLGAIHDLLLGLMLTGARPIELARAKVGDYDDETETLTLISFKGKSAKPQPRELPLGALQATAFIESLCEGKPSSASIFVRDDGMPWQHSDWDQLVRRAVREANLPQLTAYDLRHSFISEALIGGVDAMTVSRLVGTSLQMITMTYGKLVKDHAIQAFKGVRLV